MHPPRSEVQLSPLKLEPSTRTSCRMNFTRQLRSRVKRMPAATMTLTAMATTIPSDDEAELKTPSLGLPIPAGRWRQTFCFRQFCTVVKVESCGRREVTLRRHIAVHNFPSLSWTPRLKSEKLYIISAYSVLAQSPNITFGGT